MDKQHLVFVMVNDVAQIAPASRQVRLRKLTLEDGKLQMVPIPAHSLKNLSQPLVIRNVVTNQIRLPDRALRILWVDKRLE
jgi:hypothetical protein